MKKEILEEVWGKCFLMMEFWVEAFLLFMIFFTLPLWILPYGIFKLVCEKKDG